MFSASWFKSALMGKMDSSSDLQQQQQQQQRTRSSTTSSTPPYDGCQIPPRLQDKVLQTIQRNRVTMVVGPTGCGKSTQVPLLLRHYHHGSHHLPNNNSKVQRPRICVTQPRRLAAVAIAQRIAVLLQEQKPPQKIVDPSTTNPSSTKIEIGGPDVGFHVGQWKCTSAESQIVLTTAGLLLETALQQGIAAALSPYRYLILDECHERSPESDMLLCLVRLYLQQMRSTGSKKGTKTGGGGGGINPAHVQHFRVILMSATFDHNRYQQYFRPVLLQASSTRVGGGAVHRHDEDDRMDTITLETAESFANNRVTTHYLDDWRRLLPPKLYQRHEAFLRWFKESADEDLQGGSPVTLSSSSLEGASDPHCRAAGDDGGGTEDRIVTSAAARSLSVQVVQLIRTLVTWLDEHESPTGTFLIFAPTYRHLEQLYDACLIINGRCTILAVLHSAVDMEECLQAMREQHQEEEDDGENGSSEGVNVDRITLQGPTVRRIILASAIADSSVTIPGVTVVIDLCRSLQVRWNVETRQHNSRSLWSSQAICQQRQGRTGRTCAGAVYRLVYDRFFHREMPEWDTPQLQISSCHKEVLAILCARKPSSSTNQSTKVTNANNTSSGIPTPAEMLHDPRVFLQHCLDPPPTSVVQDALSYLRQIGAAHPIELKATTLGYLMANMPVEVAQARIVLQAARLGMLPEMAVLMAILNHKPTPIAHLFGESDTNEELLCQFHGDVDPASFVSTTLANLSAYIYWDVHWHQPLCERQVAAYAAATQQEGPGSHESGEDPGSFQGWGEPQDVAANAAANEDHSEWCRQNFIHPTSVRSLTESIHAIWNAMFHTRFDPPCLACSQPTPLWKRSRAEWTPGGKRSRSRDSNKDMLLQVYGTERTRFLTLVLQALSDGRSAPGIQHHARRFLGLPLPAGAEPSKTDATNEMMMRNNTSTTAVNDLRPLACVHYLQGNCRYGSRCRASHARNARRPPCRFYLAGRCNKGASCVYAHGDDDDDNDQRRNDDNQGLANRLATSQGNSTMWDMLGAHMATATATVTSSEAAAGASSLDPLVPLIESLTMAEGAMGWLEYHANQLLLLGEEEDFSFARAMALLGFAPRCATTHHSSSTSTSAAAAGEKRASPMHLLTMSKIPSTLTDVDVTRLHLDARLMQIVSHVASSQTSSVCSFAWNFPHTGVGEEEEIDENGNRVDPIYLNRGLIWKTFVSVKLLALQSMQQLQEHVMTDTADTKKSAAFAEVTPKLFSLALTLQADQFSRWGVLGLAWNTGWRLSGWCDFDSKLFPTYMPRKQDGFPMNQMDHPRMYVFTLTLNLPVKGLTLSIEQIGDANGADVSGGIVH